MAVVGDRAVAGLLSALAEAPGVGAAASFLLAQLVEITGATRAGALWIEPPGESLTLIAASGFEPDVGDHGRLSIPVADVASPIMISALARTPVRGHAPLGPGPLASLANCVILPLTRSSADQGPLWPDPIDSSRAATLMASMHLTPLPLPPGEAQRGIPAGAVFLEGPFGDGAIDDALEVVALASPILANADRRDMTASLAQELERARQAEASAHAEEDRLRLQLAETERRAIEAAVRLAEQSARLQQQAREVDRADKLKSEFLASMSHELRTPINALIGYSALLLDGVLGDVNPKQRDALTRGRSAAEHLLALINDILDLAKIEAGKMPLHLERTALRDVILEAAQQVEPIVRRKSLDFSIEVAADCPTIVTDRAKAKQVLFNLLSNAVKFTNRGRVSVEARCTPAGVRIDVIDTGIGIRDTDLQAIWEDFRQVDQSRTREFGGTGLGLSITRKLLEQVGGSVSVRSSYGEGSTFSVSLPLTVPTASTAGLAPTRQREETSA